MDCGPTLDSNGVPMDAFTPGGNPVPYIAPSAPGGLPSGPAVNLGMACGTLLFPDAFRTQFSGVGSVSRLEEKASSIYHALQVSVRRSVGRLTLSGAYTYSHSIDDSSSARDAVILDTYDVGRARASSNFDQRHLFNPGLCIRFAVLQESGIGQQDSRRMGVVRRSPPSNRARHSASPTE